MRKLMSEQGLEITVPELYGEVNGSISVDMYENEVSKVYIGIIIGDKFFRFRKGYKLSEIEYRASEDADRVSEDVLDYFASLQESLACGDDEITVDSIVVIVG